MIKTFSHQENVIFCSVRSFNYPACLFGKLQDIDSMKITLIPIGQHKLHHHTTYYYYMLVVPH